MAGLPLNIQHVSVDALIPYARNARTHSDAQVAQIAASIREFGWTNPILVDGDKGIIAGHGRLAAARKLGLSDVPVIELAHLSPTQKRAYVIADNRLALDAGWDDAMLALEMGDLRDEGFDLDLTGFNADEMNALFEDSSTAKGLTDEDAAPDVQTLTVSKPGDTWLCGKHRVMCGDSTIIDALQSLTQGQLVDMWLTDPPYNVAYDGVIKKRAKILNDSASDEQFRQFLRDSYSAADAVMKPGAAFYIWHSDAEGFNFRGAAKDAGWQVRQCLIWRKNSLVMGRQDYQWQHEPCLYGWKEGAGHLWASDRKQTTILDFDRPTRSGEHPTMKPAALFEYLMLNNTKGGDLVLDSFGGSGTTMIAAEKNGRVARLMELDPRYCDVIVKRWQDFTGKKATLEADGREFDEIQPC